MWHRALRKWVGFESRLQGQQRLAQRFRPRVECLEDRLAPAAGSLDPSFGVGGKVISELTRNDQVRDVAVQDDGKIVVVGRAYIGSDHVIAVTRYTADGSLDGSFGNGGTSQIDAGRFSIANGLAIQDDGKIVVVGTNPGNGNSNIVVLRLHVDGSRDTSFANGLFEYDFSGAKDTASDVAVQADGKIIILGTTNAAGTSDIVIMRLDSAGNVDASFATNPFGDGKRLIDLGGAGETGSGVALQDDGKILVVGTSTWATGTNDIVVVRLDGSGNIDGSFATNPHGDGKRIIDFGFANDTGSDVAIQSDGKIVVVGTSNYYGTSDLVVVRLDNAGNIDGSFATNPFGDGKRFIDYSSTTDTASAVAVQDDGRIVVVGTSSNADVFVVRLDSTGNVDEDFANHGRALLDFGGSADVAQGVAIQSDGKIVVAGQTGANIALARLDGGYQIVPGPPTVARITPSLTNTLFAGGTTLQVSFSESMLGADQAGNYELRGAGTDGLIGTGDDVIMSLAVAYASADHIATLSFAALPEDIYRLTVRDSLTDIAGNPLDGNADGVAGGDWSQDFAAASPRPVGDEIRVNTTTTGDQHYPAVAMDAAGNFVVAWTSYGQDDDGSSGIYAQRYNAAGVARGAEFRVNTTTAGSQRDPAVAMDAAGNFVVTWWSSEQDGNGWGIYAQLYDAVGNTVKGEFRVNTTTGTAGDQPAVAMDAAGNFVVTWWSVGQHGGQSGIYAQRYAAAGDALGTEFRVSATVADADSPAVAIDAAGNLVFTWTSWTSFVGGGDGSGSAVYALRYNAAGVALGNEFRVNTTTASNQWLSAVATDATGNFVITWASFEQDGGSGIYAQRYSATGDALGAEFRVNTTTVGYQWYPAVAMDAAGNFVVTWWSSEQDGNGWGIYAQLYTATGEPSGSEFRVNSTTANNQFSPAVAMNPAGRFVITWESNDQDGSGFGIFAQRYNFQIHLPSVIEWDGDLGTDWHTPENWVGDMLPGPGDIVIIGSEFAGVTIASSTNVTIAQLMSHANLNIAGGTFAIAGDSVFYSNLNLSGGALSSDGGLVVAGQFSWAGGTLAGSGTLTLEASGSMNIAAGFHPNILDGVTLNNAGTIVWMGGDITARNGAVINNAGTFEARSDNLFSYDGQGSRPIFNNTGLVEKTAGAATPEDLTHWTRFYGVTFNNDGDSPEHNRGVEVHQGLLGFAGGGMSHGRFFGAEGSALWFSGDTLFDVGSSIDADWVYFHTWPAGGTATVAGSYKANHTEIWQPVQFTGTVQGVGQLNIQSFDFKATAADFTQAVWRNAQGEPIQPVLASLNIDHGTFLASQDMLVTGSLTLTAATLAGGGTLTVAAEGELHINAGFQPFGGALPNILDGVTLINAGTAIWSGGDIAARNGARFDNGAIFDGELTGSFEVRSENQFYHDGTGAAPTFINTGTFTKSAGAATQANQWQWWTSFFGVRFDNAGTVHLEQGLLGFAGGGTSTGVFRGDADTAFWFSGNTILESGSHLTADWVYFHPWPAGGSASVRGSYAANHTVIDQPVDFSGTLEIRGTDGDDTIEINPGAQAGLVTVVVNGMTVGTFAFALGGTIRADGGNGSDTYIVWGFTADPLSPISLTVPIIIADSGTNGVDSLTVYGSETDDHFEKLGDLIQIWSSPPAGPPLVTIISSGIEFITIDMLAGDDYIDDPGSTSTILLGGPGNDTIIVRDMTDPVTVDSGDGSDTIIIHAANVQDITIANSGAGSNSVVVIGTGGVDVVAFSDTTITINGIVIDLGTNVQNVAIQTGAGNDQISVGDVAASVTALAIDGGSGANQVAVTGVAPPSVAVANVPPAVLNDGVLYVTGTAGDDLVSFAADTNGQVVVKLNGKKLGTFTPTAGVRFVGNGGNDAVEINGNGTANSFVIDSDQVELNGLVYRGTGVSGWTVNGKSGVDTFIVHGGSATLNGGGGQDTLVSALAGPALWRITANNAGSLGDHILFTSVQWLVGGLGDDHFLLVDGKIGGGIDGGAGNNTLEAAGSGSFTWKVTGFDAGTVAGTDFSRIQNLTGGAGDDTFKIGADAGGNGLIRGGNGVNQLDYSAWSTGVTVNLAAGAATGTGGVAGIRHVAGGKGNDLLIGDAQDNVLEGGVGNDILIGGAGNDTLRGGGGSDLLSGGSGADILEGGGGGDILIGGKVSYFDEPTGAVNRAAFDAIMAEWTRTDLSGNNAAQYSVRVAHLLNGGGLNGGFQLNLSTVQDDAAADSLTGGNGLDWFFAHFDDVLAPLDKNEILTVLP